MYTSSSEKSRTAFGRARNNESRFGTGLDSRTGHAAPKSSGQQSFAISCGLPALAQATGAKLTSLGFHHQEGALITFVVDAPLGFALHKLEMVDETGTRLIVMTSSACIEYWEDLWSLRPYGLLAGPVSDEELVEAVTRVASEDRYRATPPGTTPLSPTELRVLGCLARGLSNKEIAQRLGVHDKTVMNTLTIIYQKLGMENRVQTVLYYWGIRDILSDAHNDLTG